MPGGSLVVLRSTVKIGTTRNIVAPVLAATGKNFEIAMCSERTIEGNAMYELAHLPQIIGADTDRARDRSADLFRHINTSIVPTSSLETAEIIKLVDNGFRDVQFAFANELARLCDGFGITAFEVIESGKVNYPRTNVALPGLVGGPCLGKDIHILRQSAEDIDIEIPVSAAARHLNEQLPVETVRFIAEEFARRHGARAPTVAILGMAFKAIPEVDDMRGSMSLAVIDALQARFPDLALRIFDPVVPFQRCKPMFRTLRYTRRSRKPLRRRILRLSPTITCYSRNIIRHS